MTQENCCRPEFAGTNWEGGTKTVTEGYEKATRGAAITSCWIENGKMYVGNGEYSNEVSYCPFCGKESPALNE